jgi:hypothetical protein
MQVGLSYFQLKFEQHTLSVKRVTKFIAFRYKRNETII